MWLIITIVAYFFTALANLVDKLLLSRYVDKPIVYAFFIGALSIVSVVLIPFGFVMPTIGLVIFSIFVGATFILALYLLFSALKVNEASRVIPFVGGVSPIFVFFFSWIGLGIAPKGLELIAFAFLLLGIYFISRESFRGAGHTKKSLIFSFAAAIVFALYYTLSKYIYLHEAFITGFVSIAFGTFLAAMFLLIWPSHRRDIMVNFKKGQGKGPRIFFFGQAAGAIGALLTSYAISLANVTLINAMQGLQFAFLFIMVVILSKKYPQILQEKLNRQIILEKVLAIIFIGVGLVLLAVK
jgi:drug/metabolite transporter (DMT)-like permease